MDWIGLYKKYIYTLDKNTINQYIYDKNYNKKRLNAERNEILRKTIVSFILSPFLYEIHYNPRLCNWSNWIFKRLESLSSKGKHCHVCNHSLSNRVRYKCKSDLNHIKIMTCSACMVDMMNYIKEHVVKICKDETYKLFSLLKKTPYNDMCSDVFNIIFILMLH
jgi:hypothetical protein